MLRESAAAVAPGGLNVVVENASAPSWAPTSGHAHAGFPTAEETWDSLALDPGRWHRERCDTPSRTVTHHDGASATVFDNVIAARRRA